MAEVIKSGFYMKLYRTGGDGGDVSLGIYIKSAQLEQIVRNCSTGPPDPEIRHGVKLYRAALWNPTHDYAIDFRYNLPISTRDGVHYAWPLRAVGVSEGVTIQIPGLYPKSTLEAYAAAMKQCVYDLFRDYGQNVTIEIRTLGELDVAT